MVGLAGAGRLPMTVAADHRPTRSLCAVRCMFVTNIAWYFRTAEAAEAAAWDSDAQLAALGPFLLFSPHCPQTVLVSPHRRSGRASRARRGCAAGGASVRKRRPACFLLPAPVILPAYICSMCFHRTAEAAEAAARDKDAQLAALRSENDALRAAKEAAEAELAALRAKLLEAGAKLAKAESEADAARQAGRSDASAMARLQVGRSSQVFFSPSGLWAVGVCYCLTGNRQAFSLVKSLN